MALVPDAFAYTYSPSFPQILDALESSLAVTTFQTGKVLMISAAGPEKLVQLPRTFQRAMGMSRRGDMLALATKTETHILVNAPQLAHTYPRKPRAYDALFTPRATYYTGDLDVHDVELTSKGLLAVNTRFSCLALLGEAYSFAPVWTPPFITALTPDDRCHLNGMALDKDENVRFVTALGRTNSGGAWRKDKASGGVLIDVPNNTVVAEHLPMPHSPLLVGDTLYMLLSATGQVVRCNTKTGDMEIIAELDGFLRGLDKRGDYLFIGMSTLRESSSGFDDLPIAQRELNCGVAIIHEPSGQVAGWLKYEGEVRELYDVMILDGIRRPGIVNTESEQCRMAVTSPQNSWWAVSEDKQEKTQEEPPAESGKANEETTP